MDLDGRRAQHQAHGLAEGEVDPDPFVQFDRWFDDVLDAGLHEPEAMIVSTATAAGAPSSRYVLLRGRSAEGFVFFTNYDSQKGRELTENPAVSVCFPWHVLGRQVRIDGTARPTTAAESDRYFASRARGSQIGAWASPQSSVLSGRDELEARVAEVEARFDGIEVPRPENWGGYLVIPEEFEFWQGRPSRLHDRLRYRRSPAPAGGWRIDRLSP